MADPRFLLDSNACIYILEGLSDVLRMRSEDCAPGEIVTSAIVYAEVMRGLDPSDKVASEKMVRFFEAIPVMAFDEAAALAYRNVPFKRGQFDRLIAAHALSQGLVVVTSNETDFRDVPGLQAENWAR